MSNPESNGVHAPAWLVTLRQLAREAREEYGDTIAKKDDNHSSKLRVPTGGEEE